jgi:carnitine 3-dehydrogenase
MREPDEGIGTVACVGAGTIGGGWAAFDLARGKDVIAFDPAPEAETRLRAQIARAWPALETMGLAPGAAPERLRFAASLAEAASSAGFVQESVPEREELKTAVLAEISDAAPPDVIIASSSSEFLPSRIGARCRGRWRCLVGHPFAPVYLLPLVEIVAAEGTPQDILDRAARFYAGLGKRPVVLAKEHRAYIGNELLRALGAKANELVDAGVCSHADIEEVMVTSLGPRWAVMGPALA